MSPACTLVLITAHTSRPYCSERSGKNIKLLTLVDSLHKNYNVSRGLAFFLAFGGILLCGTEENRLHLTIDLHQLALHNRIEHDISLMHADTPECRKYAPTKVDEERRAKIRSITAKDYYTEKDLLEYRKTIANGKTLDAIHEKAAMGEIGLIMKVFGKTIKVGEESEVVVYKNVIDTWMGEEKLPLGEGWKKPEKEITLKLLNDEVQKVKDIEKQLKEHTEGPAPDSLLKLLEDFVNGIRKRLNHNTDETKGPVAAHPVLT